MLKPIPNDYKKEIAKQATPPLKKALETLASDLSNARCFKRMFKEEMKPAELKVQIGEEMVYNEEESKPLSRDEGKLVGRSDGTVTLMQGESQTKTQTTEFSLGGELGADIKVLNFSMTTSSTVGKSLSSTKEKSITRTMTFPNDLKIHWLRPVTAKDEFRAKVTVPFHLSGGLDVKMYSINEKGKETSKSIRLPIAVIVEAAKGELSKGDKARVKIPAFVKQIDVTRAEGKDQVIMNWHAVQKGIREKHSLEYLDKEEKVIEPSKVELEVEKKASTEKPLKLNADVSFRKGGFFAPGSAVSKLSAEQITAFAGFRRSLATKEEREHEKTLRQMHLGHQERLVNTVTSAEIAKKRDVTLDSSAKEDVVELTEDKEEKRKEKEKAPSMSL